MLKAFRACERTDGFITKDVLVYLKVCLYSRWPLQQRHPRRVVCWGSQAQCKTLRAHHLVLWHLAEEHPWRCRCGPLYVCASRASGVFYRSMMWPRHTWIFREQTDCFICHQIKLPENTCCVCLPPQEKQLAGQGLILTALCKKLGLITVCCHEVKWPLAFQDGTGFFYIL